MDEDLPPEVLWSEAAWAGCIAGAVSTDLLERKLQRAGFTDISIGDPRPFTPEDVGLYPLFPPDVLDLLRRVLSEERQGEVAVAHLVRAVRAERVADPPQATTTPQPSGVRRVDDIAPDAVEAPGATVRHLAGVEDADLKVLDVEPGASTPHHIHLHAHEGVIVSGTGHLRLHDGPKPLRPGDMFRVNPNDPHAIVNDGDVPLRLVCMDCLVG